MSPARLQIGPVFNRPSVEDQYRPLIDPNDPNGLLDQADENSQGIHTLQRQLSSLNESTKLAQFADRGTGWYKEERDRRHIPSLVETGRHAGRSRVNIREMKSLMLHTWKRDFFTSVIQLPLPKLFALICCVEVGSWSFWAVVWFLYHNLTGRQCMTGFDSSTKPRAVISAVLFAVETQQTIGYGARSPRECVGSAVILVLQCLTQLLLEASCVGLVFSRLSHPKNRGRSIFISESAVIARRDGALKFMFRVADIRATQVIEPRITAYLYAFGSERMTAEGERIPSRVEPLKVNYSDATLLLPVIIEHTIDFTSPLFGHNHDTLMEQNAEIIVTLEGSTEMGSTFSCRQSYLPPEIHWGHTFSTIIRPAEPPATSHSVSMSKFHEVEPQPGLALMTPSELSRYVLSHERGIVPYPSLAENTLVVSDDLVVCSRGPRTFLMARIGDTKPHNTVSVSVKAYVYRWKQRVTPQGEVLPFKIQLLDLRSDDGAEGSAGSHNLEVLLRMPQLVLHEISSSSPLASWSSETGMFKSDSDSEVVIQVSGVKASTGLPVVVKRNYMVVSDIKWDRHFVAMVQPPSRSERKPVINWSLFHSTEPNPNPGKQPSPLRSKSGAADPSPSRPPSLSRKNSTSDPPPPRHAAAEPSQYGSAWGDVGRMGLVAANQPLKMGPSSRFHSSRPMVQQVPLPEGPSEGECAAAEHKDLSEPSTSNLAPRAVTESHVHDLPEGKNATDSVLASLFAPDHQRDIECGDCQQLSSVTAPASSSKDTRTHPQRSSDQLGDGEGSWADGKKKSSSANNSSSGGGMSVKRDADWARTRSLFSITFDSNADEGEEIAEAPAAGKRQVSRDNSSVSSRCSSHTH